MDRSCCRMPRLLARGATLLPGLAAALLPKCPFCVPLYAAALGALGAAGWVEANHAAIIFGLLALSFGLLLWMERRSGSFRVTWAYLFLTAGVVFWRGLP